ncbi:XRE family transcriptional regulator [Paenibacillus sp. FSL R7-0273]|uniref:helix-turn-helix transcriptional regulator n=1 Tax=Paenibacillus sp. FSL R7-0273 TaxID=1536772 RepID=UPI0004F6514B|nr:helix-turn-helix transcriptional regulator [Paenibacillus sp. FSL R7-0273]AIQ47458.1 XRE family transcriptional regulator [Paenibacillus sp. FSL R7-0273]
MGKLGNRVRELRARDRLSQEELAKRVGASRQTIALIERGDYSPSVLLGLKIAAVFGVLVEDVFSIQDE